MQQSIIETIASNLGWSHDAGAAGVRGTGQNKLIGYSTPSIGVEAEEIEDQSADDGEVVAGIYLSCAHLIIPART